MGESCVLMGYPTGPLTTKSTKKPNPLKPCLASRDFFHCWISGSPVTIILLNLCAFITIWKIYIEENSAMFSILTIQHLNLPQDMPFRVNLKSL